MIEKVIEQGWADHDKDSAGVFARVRAAIGELRDTKHVPALAGLLTHVAGEHRGEWREGLAALEELARVAGDEKTAEGQAVLRSRATLLVAAGDRAEAERCIERAHAGAAPLASTKARVLAVAASALAGQKRVEDGTRLFEEALALAAYGPDKSGPAARALAVTGNNLACALEERKGRTAAEDRLLELAARTGRQFWEIAGSWVEVSRAEYRLAMTYVALGRGEDAVKHARECLALCERNDADAGERFFAHEALMRAHRSSMKNLLEKVDPEMRALCEQTLAKHD